MKPARVEPACNKPPSGWGCIRPGGHSGPCAAVPVQSAHGPAYLCEHANENPHACPCDRDCYCKAHTCKERTRRTPEYRASIVGPRPDRTPPYEVTIRDGSRHVVTVFAGKFDDAEALASELVAALTDELARTRAEAT